jgi:hypothetical protein
MKKINVMKVTGSIHLHWRSHSGNLLSSEIYTMWENESGKYASHCPREGLFSHIPMKRWHRVNCTGSASDLELNMREIGHGRKFRTHSAAEVYEGLSRSFRTGSLERELQMVQLSTTRCSCIAILWVSLVSSATITLHVAFQRVFIVVYFVIDSVRKVLGILLYKQGTLANRTAAYSMTDWLTDWLTVSCKVTLTLDSYMEWCCGGGFDDTR